MQWIRIIVGAFLIALLTCQCSNDSVQVSDDDDNDNDDNNDNNDDSSSDSDADGDGDSDGDSDADSDADTDGDADTDNEPCDIDLLFIIDNSTSMTRYQTALNNAFPEFTDALINSSLLSDTSIHVGVTSTEMGYSGYATYTSTGGECTFTGDDGQSEDAFYITPDVQNTDRNGAQGRLYSPEGQPAYFDFNVSDGADKIEELREWFAAASAIGEGGSNIEMTVAPAGWAVNAANAATNEGFFRDGGTLLVLFFLQDEPDQTPMTVDGKNGGQAMLDRLAAAKSECGGLKCVVAGGFTKLGTCVGRPIDTFLEGLIQDYVIEDIPKLSLTDEEITEEMANLLTTSLTELILSTCQNITVVKGKHTARDKADGR